MHTAEHILNQTMVRMFNCKRAISAHIEKKKSKCDYALPEAPSETQIKEIEDNVNEIISQNLPIWIEYTTRQDAQTIFDLDRLPENASEKLRIVHIGDYDSCPCIGLHVENTSQIGKFILNSSEYKDGILRIRFKLSN